MGVVVSMADFKARRTPAMSSGTLNYEIRLVELGLQRLRDSITSHPYVEDRERAAVAMIPLQEKLYRLRQMLKQNGQG